MNAFISALQCPPKEIKYPPDKPLTAWMAGRSTSHGWMILAKGNRPLEDA